MLRWKATFVGREVGAIGAMQQFTEVVVADNADDAFLALYRTHEHIRLIGDIEPFGDAG